MALSQKNALSRLGLLLATTSVAACSITGSLPEQTDPGCSGDAPGPGALIGMDIESGEKAWEAKVGNPSGVAAFDDSIVVLSTAGTMRTFDQASGEMIWCLDLEAASEQEWNGMVGAGDVVVIIDEAEVVAFDASTGAETWRHPIGSGASLPQDNTASTIAPSEPQLVGGSSVWVIAVFVDEVVLEALDPTNGAVLQPPPPLPSTLPLTSYLGGRNQTLDGVSLTSPKGHEEYVPDRQEIVIAPVEVISGKALWEKTVPGMVASLAPSPDGPIIVVIDQTGGTGDFVGAPDTRVTAYQSSDGDLRWETSHGSPGKGGPYSVEGNYAFMTSTEDILVGLIAAEHQYRD